MATVPTVTELADWMKIIGTLSTEKTASLQLALDAAVDDMDERCWLPSPWNNKVKLACLMHAARLSKRADSPEGVAGFGEFGSVQVSSFDTDVERLLSRYLRADGFA